MSVSSQVAASGCADSISRNWFSINSPKPKPLAMAKIIEAIGTIAIIVEKESCVAASMWLRSKKNFTAR